MIQKKLWSLLALLGFISIFAGNLKVKVYNPGTRAIFPITSTIIYGDKDAILVDAQFQKQYAEQLVKEIKATGKNLKTVFISHSDPDFYFGLDVIKKAFPDAKIISTAQTAYLISASKDDKMGVWKPQLKADAPSEIIIPEAVTSIPDLEGNKIEIIQNQEDPAHSFLWIPSIKIIAGGISVSVGSHLWMADTQNIKAIDQWIGQIDAMKALKPEKVIPSHFAELSTSPQSLDFVKSYLENYKQAVTENKTSSAIVDFMVKKYPDLPGKGELEMGVKVYLKEMDWDLKSPYPAIGRKVEVDFGTIKFLLDFKDNKTMTFIGTAGSSKNSTDTVEYTAVEVAKNVFMVYWHEPHLGFNVTHIQDYNKNIIYSNIAGPDGTFTHPKGTLKILK
ncbi:glyoxylase-like metal-dependent hydrolase (beta-lactamase superfamily II) [Chryseobacterium vietnamense]|uniref:MBL fold metallo-hydrolase n=1 Tax=Chryseobacterium vietnamense TaxID=866785 RepID=UPI002859143A|nr:MBL fold metallo-hydrolase [Chryseobacterium vietnamense]MDR6488559.1 glyoxylase-like metal-dependent hydrolase (beta-lactamase superfamily II) [Chryseobacterium vietnamense]